MATYKVIQDIEAEDKLLGPLSFRQFVYALIAAGCLYFCVISVMKGIPFLLAIFLPPALFTGFFAFPWGRDQPTEVWALAKIQFMLKSHRRIWDQSGVKELVTITAPKREEKNYTDGLSQVEVKSRLHALADTLDSRGWVTKNVDVNTYAQPSILANNSSDRLIDINSMPHEVSGLDVTAADDMLDPQGNPLAQQFDQMIAAASQAHHQQLVQQLSQPQTQPSASSQPTQQPPADYWFLNQPAQLPVIPKNDTMFTNDQVVLPGTDDAAASLPDASADEKALAAQLKAQHNEPEVAYSHLRTIQPLGSKPAQPTQQKPPAATPHQPSPALLELAQNNDLNISTIARQANKKEPPDDEVVISLH
ncbi:MAG TPA: PrgI family protein [Candidatus Saccharimonadales bacterium]|nr:PrgI family protein [Candidatus Saccharimonadales bacterium]